ncbi:MAG TPA: LysR family transcriptional regulator [Gammaproteobacteria bacterium]|nr:LysR family transcriptional regulator [Gammaproteobacteria bacterium]
MSIFFHVVDAGGFSAAARRINMAKSAVSRHISELEKQLGVKLLNRTTRQLSMTESGEIYFQACSSVVAQATEVSNKIRGLTGEVSGTIKISCPTALATDYLTPVLKSFSNQYSQLKIDLSVDDQVVNMVDEGIDIAVRVGWLENSNLIARKIAELSRRIYVAREYIEQNGLPDSPEQLINHEWVIFTLLPTPYRLVLRKQGREQVVRIDGRFRTNNILTLKSLILEAAGIGVLSEFLVKDEIENGDLVHVLPEYSIDKAGIYVVYPNRDYLPLRSRLLIDYLNRELNVGALI